MSNNNMRELSSIAGIHITQQLQYEEIQQLTHATSASTKALKECLDAFTYFNTSDLTLYSSWRMKMLAKLSVDEDVISSLINQD
ncbi:hypothetical protein BDBG_18029 [Blastomyces gilchristii SLH14081]|uniref:Uncharacterized protein n=1 Tax=Blastomyces gilchristii (strain SLH14081) TaxID=559298 RepID=A0A179V4P1_BLAGS|nr:uncharacterized protein BDBG_18029 [Blastomyces gilchristii SLH14081]OAT14419.1 hypothetical protein BDBG_18029 [Blastomyces gilchristii SLH14081]